MEDAIITSLVSIAGSSSVVGLLIKVMLKQLTAEWREMGESIKSLVTEVQTIKTKIAVHEALAEDNRLLRSDIEALKRDMILVQSQVQAAWKAIDRPRISDTGRA